MQIITQKNNDERRLAFGNTPKHTIVIKTAVRMLTKEVKSIK